jgi:DNA-binding GntR family transcriptional regulator
MKSMNRIAMQVPDADSSVASRIARVLAQRIVSGALPPGLPVRQDHVAAEFQASHVPVREAFRKLEAQGLLVSKPRCGVTVSLLDPATVLEVSEMRAELEGLALRFAFPRLGDDDLATASSALAEAEASKKIAVWEAANQRFHLALTAPCNMPRLMATIIDLHRSSARFLFATWKDLDWQQRSDNEHRAILDKIRRRDRRGACRALETHIRAAGDALVQRLRKIEPSRSMLSLAG